MFWTQTLDEIHGGFETGVGCAAADGAEGGVVEGGERADYAAVEGYFDGVVAQVEITYYKQILVKSP